MPSGRRSRTPRSVVHGLHRAQHARVGGAEPAAARRVEEASVGGDDVAGAHGRAVVEGRVAAQRGAEVRGIAPRGALREVGAREEGARVALHQPPVHEAAEGGAERVLGEARVEVLGLGEAEQREGVARGRRALAAERQRRAQGRKDVVPPRAMRRSMRAAALAVALLVNPHGFAQPAPAPGVALASVLEPLLAGLRVPGARLGVIVVDAATGQVVFQHDADLPLNPASNAKILTAAAALSLLGPERRFVTALHGDVRGGVARELVLKGQGDPSLRTADLLDLARQARAAGLRRVEGDVIVDDTWLGAEHLPPAFEQRPRETAAYRAAVGAVSVDENVLTVRVSAPARRGPSRRWRPTRRATPS